MWAAACVAVYCLLRAGEYLEGGAKTLRRSDLEFMDPLRSSARLTLRNTKSEVWNHDRHAYFFRNGSASCPTFFLTHYLDNFPPDLVQGRDDPLFLLEGRIHMTKKSFLSWLRVAIDALEIPNLPGCDFFGISTRKGGATSLRLAGASDEIIRIMGRWAETSTVFRTYQSVSTIDCQLIAHRMSRLSEAEIVKAGKGSVLYGFYDANHLFVEQPIPLEALDCF
jgi:hypothetical protein